MAIRKDIGMLKFAFGNQARLSGRERKGPKSSAVNCVGAVEREQRGTIACQGYDNRFSGVGSPGWVLPASDGDLDQSPFTGSTFCEVETRLVAGKVARFGLAVVGNLRDRLDHRNCGRNPPPCNRKRGQRNQRHSNSYPRPASARTSVNHVSRGAARFG